MRDIKLSDAKAKLSAVVDQAVQGKPVAIVRNGRREVVLLGSDEWLRLSRVPSFGCLAYGN